MPGRLLATVVLLAGGMLTLRSFMGARNMDEYQHAQMAWLMVQGQLPYRDFFEHHLPLLHLLAMPVLTIFRPEESFGRTILALTTLRTAMLAPLMLTVFFVWQITRRLAPASPMPALTALALFVASGIVLDKGMEFRPDVPAAALVAGAIWGMIRPEIPLQRRSLFVGLLLGTAIGFTQKTLFLLPGFGLALLLELWRVRTHRVSTIVQGLMGLLTVPVLIVLGFAAFGAAGDMIQLNFLGNATWPVERPLYNLLLDTARSSFITMLAGSIATIVAIRGDLRTRQIALVAASGVLGLFILPISYAHYLLIWLAAPCVLVAPLCARLSTRISTTIVALALIQGMVWTGLHLTSINYFEFRTLERMHTHAPPGTRVLAGWSQQFPFRPPALWHFYLNREVCPALSAQEQSALIAALEDPGVMLASAEVATCINDPRVRALLNSNFRRVEGEAHMLVRRTP